MRKEKTIGIIGIGIFLCLTLQAISFLSFKIVQLSLLLTTMNPMLLHGISKYLSLILTLLLFWTIIKKIKTFDFEDNCVLKRVFIFSIVGYLITQAIEFTLPFITATFESTEYLISMKNYSEGLEGQTLFRELVIDTPVWLLEYIVIAIIVFKELKTAANKKQA